MKLSTHRSTAGFTILEVLIAMLVFAIGMLGLAGMQGTALKDNNDAYLRSKAVFFAYDLGDRIRANPDFWRLQITKNPAGTATANALLTATKNTVEAFTNNYPSCNTDDPPTVGAALVFCNTVQLAQYDWYRIRQDLIAVLPNGAIALTNLDDPDSIEKIIRITVSWNLTNTTINGIAPFFTYDVRP